MTGGVKLAAKGFKGHSHHGVSFGTDKVPVPLLRSLTFSAVQRWEVGFTYKADPAPEVFIFGTNIWVNLINVSIKVR